MKISIASDHAGFDLKNFLVDALSRAGHEVLDHGAHQLIPEDDYPQYISKVAKDVSAYEAAKHGGFLTSHNSIGEPNERVMGIVIGGSGQGEAMAANKYSFVRAVILYGGHAAGGSRDLLEHITVLSRKHNDANVLSLGARFISNDEAWDMVSLWLDTEFSGDDRHVRRISEIEDIEERQREALF